MMAGFLPLLFNPQAWIAVGLALFIGFGSGVVKGWNASNADHWRLQAEELTKAAQDKERLAKANERRALAAEAEREQFQTRLQVLIDETNSQGNACKLSDLERQRLLDLAAGRG
jgi:hypothetical protein